MSSFNEAELRQAGFRRIAVVPPAAIVPTESAAGAGAGVGATAAASGARWVERGAPGPDKGIELAVMALLGGPGASTIPRRRSRWWAGRSCRPIPPRCIASWTTWACTTPCCSAAGSATPPWLPPWPNADLFRADLAPRAVRGARAGGDRPSACRSWPTPAGALPEVVGDAGLLVDALNPYAVAEAVARLRREAGLREILAAATSRRVDVLDLPSAGDRAVDLVSALSGRP